MEISLQYVHLADIYFHFEEQYTYSPRKDSVLALVVHLVMDERAENENLIIEKT